MEGWIKLYREMLEWPLFRKPNTCHLFTYLLLSANIRQTNWNGKVLQRGQIVTTLKTMSCESGLTMRQTRTALCDMVSDKQILIKATNKNTIITICYFDNYQSRKNTSDKQKKVKATRKATNKKSKSDKQTPSIPYIYNKNVFNKNKEINKEKKIMKVSDYDLSFCDKDFVPVMLDWLQYKIERRETYNSKTALKKCYNILYKLSAGNASKAQQIVDQSEGFNYAGLFPLKDEKVTRGRKEQENINAAWGR